MFKVNNKEIRMTPCSSVSVINFEHIIAGWNSSDSGFFCVYTDIDKDDCLLSNNNQSMNNLWSLFSTMIFILKSWFNNRSNTKLRLLLLLVVSVLLFLHKHAKTSDHHESIRSFTKHEFF